MKPWKTILLTIVLYFSGVFIPMPARAIYYFILVIGISIWVVQDSIRIHFKEYKSRVLPTDSVSLFFACLFFWFTVFPWYLTIRYKILTGQPLERTIRFRCPNCGLPLKVRSTENGSTQNCPKCGKEVAIPMGASNILTDIAPGSSRAKKFMVRTGFFILGRGLQAASRFDSYIKKEISCWDEGFTVMMKVRPEGPSLAWEKLNGRIRYMSSRSVEADLVILMKNLDTALLMVIAQIGTSQAYAQNRIGLEGSTVDAMILTRCLNAVEAYLFPKFVSRKILKRLPKMTLKRLCIRFVICFPGIVFGL